MKRAVSLGLILSLAAASLALAAGPVKGATYRGAIDRAPSNFSLPISFQVSKSGKTVSRFSLADSYPVYCQGGGFPHLGTGGSGRITKRGTFTAKLALISISTNKPEGWVIVSGAFGHGGTVSGKVRTDINGSFGRACNGSSPFSAKK